ncbi:MAG: hypothetical protein ACKOZZ_15810 [Bacteroidota bacterium]|jgi:hypothetical protein
MKKSNTYTLFLFLFSFIFLSGCLNNEEYSPEEIQQLIQNEVDKRVDEYVTIRKAQCEESLLTEATRLLDSMLIAEAREMRDTLFQPSKPERPETPSFKKLEVDIPLKPLFEKTDSLKQLF